VAVTGVVAMIAGPGAQARPSAAGLAQCLGAGLSYALYTLVLQRMVAGADAERAPDAGAVTAAIFGVAALIALPLAAALAGAPQLRLGDLAVLAWLGVMSTGVAYLLYSHALRHVSGATAVALALGEPVTAFVLAIGVVGERPGWVAGAGLALVIAGLIGVIRAEGRGRS
jgi:DME family drug/metabolite transporter